MKRVVSLIMVIAIAVGLAFPARAESYTSKSYLRITDGYLDGYCVDTDLDQDAEGDGWAWDADSFTLTLMGADLSAYIIQINNPQREVAVDVVHGNRLGCFELFDRNAYLQLPYNYSLKLEFVGTGSLVCPNLSAPEVYFSGPAIKTDSLSSCKKVFLNAGEVSLANLTASASGYPQKLSIGQGTLIADIREEEHEENSVWLNDYAAIVSAENADFLSEYKLEDENGDTVTLEFASIPISDRFADEGYVSTRHDGSYAPYVKITNPACSEPDQSAPTAAFADVAADAYYYAPVMWAVEKGITNGMTETAFGPENTCTRGQIVTFLWRASGSPEPKSGSNPFRDVTAGDYFYKAVLWAVEKGITSGVSASSFAPNDPCTRGQVATFLWRAQGKPGAKGSSSFSDVASNAYYYDAVLWAVANGVTNGMGNGTFAPDAPCTRGQIVTFLYRAMA